MTTDTLTLQRPEGISDGRWAALQSRAHLVITGHAVWCEDHQESEHDDGGWCRAEFRSYAGDAVLYNGTMDGRVAISLYGPEGVALEDLSPAQATALETVLKQAVQAATWAPSDLEEAQA